MRTVITINNLNLDDLSLLEEEDRQYKERHATPSPEETPAPESDAPAGETEGGSDHQDQTKG